MRKGTWIVVLSLAVLLPVCFFGVEHLLDADTWRGKIEAALSDSLGRPVQLGHLSFSLLSGSLAAESLSIADDPSFSAQPFLTARDIRIGVAVLPLVMHHELHIASLTIDQPKISLLRREDGVWNYSSLGGKGKKNSQSNSLMPNLTVSKFAIKGGEMNVGSVPAQAGQAHVYTDFDVDADTFSLNSSFPFSARGKLPGDGSLDVSGTAGPVNENDASLTPVSAQVSLKHADLAAAGMVDPRQGISGVADLDAKVNSNGQVATATGTLHAAQLKLAARGTPRRGPSTCNSRSIKICSRSQAKSTMQRSVPAAPCSRWAAPIRRAGMRQPHRSAPAGTMFPSTKSRHSCLHSASNCRRGRACREGRSPPT